MLPALRMLSHLSRREATPSRAVGGMLAGVAAIILCFGVAELTPCIVLRADLETRLNVQLQALTAREQSLRMRLQAIPV